jgi:hypothetical protein
MENSINHRDLEGINLVNSGAVAQAKPSRPGFDPFEGQLFGPFLNLKNCVFLSLIVNEFKFVYLASFSVFHTDCQPGPVALSGSLADTQTTIDYFSAG